MRLAPRELVLLLSFLILMITGGLIVGLKLMTDWSRAAGSERDQAELALLEAELALVDRDTWLQRRQWLDRELPPLVSVGDADSELLEVTSETAARRGARLAAPSLLEPVVNGDLHAARVSFNLGGDLESVMSTLHELVQPRHFREIELLRLETDPSGPAEVRAQVRLRGYYHRSPERQPTVSPESEPESEPDQAAEPAVHTEPAADGTGPGDGHEPFDRANAHPPPDTGSGAVAGD